MALAASTAGSAAVTPAPGGSPAQWRTYDLLIDLQQLPRSYSCTQLWYKMRDVLLDIGARRYMLIEPYACATPGKAAALSPRVHLKFQLPFQLAGADTRYAEFTSLSKTVRLAPGAPASLERDDCELMDQLRGALLAAVPVRVSSATFRCGRPSPSFAITVVAAVAAPGATGQ
ncbi:MAG TPA: hypothetical protein VET66_10730 [Steroidobacteraceae bacterium]|nr:hypothetical protein [Steroidobacteraceae bacterium]